VSFTAEQRRLYEARGHVTVPGLFSEDEALGAIADIERWGANFLGELSPAQRAWYLDPGVKGREVLRKLDNPVFHRPVLRALAGKPALVRLVEALIGPGVSVYFSQIFFKPPHGGGPKPAHQDNFYFGPQDRDRLVTAWIALDDATIENGCLYFGVGSNRGALYPHTAPAERPYDLQVAEDRFTDVEMEPAPVPRGGVSFHHGNTLHRSGDNHSPRWRRACAVHYVANDNPFVTPALPYDTSLFVRIT
jgi:ectoine hydroxylase-related dioxygenase (phytanoyl-CoA dioxygenase family)